MLLSLMLACALGLARADTEPLTQRELIDSAFAKFVVEPSDHGRVFFLGFAGYGKERVFAEEIKLAAKRVGEKFGSGPRTVLLVNDRRDLSSLPLANHENLLYSLLEMSRRMDSEKDVLFLVLSSHGARNAMIEVSNTGMPAVGLSARNVAKMLDRVGIRNRVVVVSACFSGAFINPLKNENTIVITAASKSRASFGCSDDRHLTYFGEAFFRDALPAAGSLRSAFDVTRTEIRRREKEEGVKPSNPQSWFGQNLEAHLAPLTVPGGDGAATPPVAQGR